MVNNVSIFGSPVISVNNKPLNGLRLLSLSSTNDIWLKRPGIFVFMHCPANT